MQRKRSSGFTLTELLMALVISVAVFAAMGALMNRCFSLWLNAQAQWKLAQHARVTRLQILNGAFGVGTGLLASTNIVIGTSGSWKTIQFSPVTKTSPYSIYGYPQTNSQQNIWVIGTEGYAWAQTVSDASSSDTPSVLVNQFDASISNQSVVVSYTLNFKSMGKNFELPQVIEAHLVNE